MKVTKSERGFEFLEHDVYPPDADELYSRLASQSSALDMEYEGNAQPGSSYLWIGQNHHLNRKQVEQFVAHLQSWLETGQLETGE